MVVAIPLFSIVASIIVFMIALLGGSNNLSVCAFGSFVISVILAGLVGGVLLLLGGYVYPQSLALATDAGITSIIAGTLSCCSTLFYFLNRSNGK